MGTQTCSPPLGGGRPDRTARLYLIRARVIRSNCSRETVTAHSLKPTAGIAALILLAWLWIGLTRDRIPCFLGIPNCDQESRGVVLQQLVHPLASEPPPEPRAQQGGYGQGCWPRKRNLQVPWYQRPTTFGVSRTVGWSLR